MTSVNTRRWVLTTIVIVACAGAIGRVSGQAPPAAAQGDVLTALLAEVRGLRAAMENIASAGPRVQLFASRLQLQEGRLAGMVRRLDSVRDSLASGRRELEQMNGMQKMMEAGGGRELGGPPPEDLATLIPGIKQQVAGLQANVDRLAAEEMQLTQDLTTEQARWIEINQRLDELEKSLAKR